MRKLNKQMIIATFFAVVAFFFGYAFPKETPKTVQEPVRVENTIAIVNDDQRVDKADGTSDLFSKTFIEKYFTNQEIKTEVTSLTNAENGVTNKKYAGYVYFPSNFTAGLLSYNKLVPDQTAIKYKLNQNMTKEQMVVTDRFIDQQIAATTNDINYLYLVSFFKTINKSQGDVARLQDLPKVVETQTTSISNKFEGDVSKLETDVNEDVKRTNEAMKRNAEPIKPTKLLEYDIEQVRAVDPQKLVIDLSAGSTEVAALNFSEALTFRPNPITTDLQPFTTNINSNLLYGTNQLNLLSNNINNASGDLTSSQNKTKEQLQASFKTNQNDLTLDKPALIEIKDQLEAMKTYEESLGSEFTKSTNNQVKLEEQINKLNQIIDNMPAPTQINLDYYDQKIMTDLITALDNTTCRPAAEAIFPAPPCVFDEIDPNNKLVDNPVFKLAEELAILKEQTNATDFTAQKDKIIKSVILNTDDQDNPSAINKLYMKNLQVDTSYDNTKPPAPDLEEITKPTPSNKFPVFDTNYQNFSNQITQDATISNLSLITREYCNNSQASLNPLKLYACQLPPTKQLDLKIFNTNAAVDNPNQELSPEMCGIFTNKAANDSLYCQLVGNVLPDLNAVTKTFVDNLHSTFGSIKKTVFGPVQPANEPKNQPDQELPIEVLPPAELNTNLVAFGNEYNTFLQNKLGQIQTLNTNYDSRNTVINELISTKQDAIFDIFEQTVETNVDQTVNKKTITDANTKLDEDYDRLTAPFKGECTACVRLTSLSQLNTLVSFNQKSISTIGVETNKLHGAYQDQLFGFKTMFEPAKSGEEINLSYVSYIANPLGVQKITNESPVMTQTKVINPVINVTNLVIIGSLVALFIIVLIVEKIIMARVKRRGWWVHKLIVYYKTLKLARKFKAKLNYKQQIK
ncbi:MAG: hypothetical protein ACRCUP_00195 [Mycoplasmatales bacterium]